MSGMTGSCDNIRVGLLGLLLLAAPAVSKAALAADLSAPGAPIPTKAPPLASPAYDWSGFYFGVHFGNDWGRARVVDNGVLTESSVPMNGAIGGLLAGINWQQGMLVYGLEGDFGASSLLGHGISLASPLVFPNEYNVNLSGNIRGRVGVAVLPQTLLYAAGGLALGDFRFREGVAPVRTSAVMAGWSVGAGLDQVLADNLVGRVEYLYADYGNRNFTVAPGDTYNVGFKGQVLRAALIAKIGPEAAVPRAGAFAMAGSPANWTGFYIGADLGGAIQSGDTTSNFVQNTAPPTDSNMQGAALHGARPVGGAHAGYNRQFAGSWVAGVEGDWQWTGARTSLCRQTSVNSSDCADNGFGYATLDGETRSIGSLRGRLGYAIDRVLVYGTGGAAFADTHTSLGVNCPQGCGANSIAITASADSSKVRTGWVAGAGIETMLDSNWTVRAEYLHYGFGRQGDQFSLPTNNCFADGPCGLSWSRDLNIDVVRAGVSYRLGG